MTAADDTSTASTGTAPAQQLSILQFLIIVAALTLAAAGIGFLFGQQFLSGALEPAGKPAEAGGYLGALRRVEAGNLKPLAPIVTNLAGSQTVWIRIESSLLFNETPKDADALAARISEDIVGFLRTVPIQQIQGGTGFQYLSEDLNERVRARSDGQVRELIIQGMIIE